MNKIKLTLGDWSNDGHGMTEDLFIETSITIGELRTYYNKGKVLIGFDLEEEVASDYEDRRIKKVYLDKLIRHGFNPKRLDDYVTDGDEDDEHYGPGTAALDSRTYAEIYLFFVEKGYEELIGDDEFKWHFTNEDIPSIEIGGYGLFSH